MNLVARLPLTVRHRYNFAPIAPDIRELDAAGWDQLRLGDTGFGFSAAPDRRAALTPFADDLMRVLARLKVHRLCSYGVGTGDLEWTLAARGIDVVCTEYAPATVAALSGFMPRVVQHDLRDGPLDGFDAHLLHRVDTELSDAEWRSYFQAASERHIVVVSAFVTAAVLLKEGRLFLRRATPAGWLRTERRFASLLPARAERITVGGFPCFLVS